MDGARRRVEQDVRPRRVTIRASPKPQGREKRPGTGSSQAEANRMKANRIKAKRIEANRIEASRSPHSNNFADIPLNPTQTTPSRKHPDAALFAPGGLALLCADC